MTALPKLDTVEQLSGFRFTGPEVVTLADAQWIECEECAGAGFNYLDCGPSGATLDCDHCNGDGGWFDSGRAG